MNILKTSNLTKQKKRTFTLTHQNYRSNVIIQSHEFVRCDREHAYRNETQIDTYGPSWNLIISSSNQPIELRHGEGWININEPFALFVPAFSIIEIKISPGLYRWTSFMGHNNYSHLPNQILLINEPIKNLETPMNLNDFFGRLNKSGFRISEQKQSSAVANRLRLGIASSYREPTTISEICRQLGYNRHVVSRAFKKAYNMSAVEYRHRIRIFAVLRLMTLGYRITDALTEVGISDSKTFLIQFKKYIEMTPLEIKKIAN